MLSKKELAITFAIIFIIFSVGFVLRVESTHLTGIPADEKAYYEDQNGLPYTYEFDSYYNYRLTKNYIDHGYIGDTLVNGKNWDLHSTYPPGTPIDYPPLIVYISAIFYEFVNFFVKVPLIVTCFWLPAFIGPLSGVVTYLFLRRFTNEYGALAAGILTVTVPIYFFRTIPGWFDTDMFNLLFPLLIMWFINESICAENNKKMFGFSFLAAFSTFLFANAWNGWMYVVAVVMISLMAYIVVCKIRSIETKHIWEVLGYFTFFTLLFLVPTGLFDLESFSTALKFLNTGSGMIATNYWPNIGVSVSELQKPSIEDLISSSGLVIFLGIMGLLWIFRVMLNKDLKKKYLNKITWFFYLFLIIWTLIGFFSLKEGVRFIFILLPPLIVSSGIMVGICIGYLDIFRNIRFGIFKSNQNLIKIVSIVILLLVVIPGILNIYNNFSNLKPLVNDDLWNSAVWINNNTPNDTVVIAEWDYGNLIPAISNRPTSADGGLNSFRIYWIDKAFATNNESLSLGIFSMLATSGDKGYKTLNNYTGNTARSVGILNDILGVNRETAETILVDNYGLNQTAAEDVLQYTHPTNPRHFVVLTSGVKGAYSIFHFGTWDFNKMQGGNYTYSYGNIKVNENSLSSTNNVKINLETGNATWYGEAPYCVINVTNGNVEKRYIDKNSDFCIILLMDNMQSVVIDKQFENSTFTKLWLERSNSTVFKSIYENKNATIWEPV
jgi:dolichyl-diphosphooligosaccharide--protein glycosyltransferase